MGKNYAMYAPVINWHERTPSKVYKYKKAENKPVARSNYYNVLFNDYFKGWK
nr:hypothetical protein [Mammaliicoccus sp. Marseille-Q6498]